MGVSPFFFIAAALGGPQPTHPSRPLARGQNERGRPFPDGLPRLVY